MKIGIAADHGGYELKKELISYLASLQMEVEDFGAFELNQGDDYPDYVVPMAKALADNKIDRAIAVCGSGVGASVVANKVHGVRAALICDHFSAHQGVEDDDLNMICLGGRVIGLMTAQELVGTFLATRFTGADRHVRRLRKVKDLEEEK